MLIGDKNYSINCRNIFTDSNLLTIAINFRSFIWLKFAYDTKYNKPFKRKAGQLSSDLSNARRRELLNANLEILISD